MEGCNVVLVHQWLNFICGQSSYFYKNENIKLRQYLLTN